MCVSYLVAISAISNCKQAPSYVLIYLLHYQYLVIYLF
jgi:hypothetical protein